MLYAAILTQFAFVAEMYYLCISPGADLCGPPLVFALPGGRFPESK